MPNYTITASVWRRLFFVLKHIFIIFLFITALALQVGAADRKLALVIGNSDYQRVPALPNPSNDATAIAAGLDKIGFDVIKLIDATGQQQKNAVGIFLERMTQYDIGLFFYAGHGISINGYNYLIPVDASISSQESVKKELLRVDRILGASINKKKILVFLDACRDNPFKNQVAKLDKMKVSRGLLISKRVKQKKVDASQGLSRLDSGNENLFVAFATQPGNVALDGMPGEKHSPFSKGIITHLQEPLEVRELMTKVRATVAQASDFKQIPWEQNSLLELVYLGAKPDLGKMELFHIANVSKVNRTWGFVVATLTGKRKPEVGEFLKIDLGENSLEAKVGKVMTSSISLIPASWEKEIPSGAKVMKEEFTEK
jgi:hypothetical protein